MWPSLPKMSKKVFRNQRAIQTANPAAPAVGTSAPITLFTHCGI